MGGVSSPTNYISWGWRFIISSSLQRCVWCGYNDTKIFPNQYIVFVGPAGVGKGMVINPVTKILRYHKRKDFTTATPTTTQEQAVIINAINKANQEDAEEGMTKMKGNGEKIDATLFPYAPDATTFEALVEAMGKSFRRRNIMVVNGDGHPKMDIYGHCSMYFALPELGSLMRKHADSVINYLLGVYDCPPDYEYVTKNKGKDRVRRGCINFLAGTTPQFMDTVFNQKLIDQGFSSRCFFIFANKNRKNVFIVPPLTDEQLQHEKDMLAHVKSLALLYGECRVEPSTWSFLQDWWDKECNNKQKLSPKLDPYKARKNIHVVKVAMANHFGETCDMHIPRERFEEAIEILEQEEKNMHLALTFEGDNPLGKVTDEVLEYIRGHNGVNSVDLMVEFWKQLPGGKKSMEEILQYLVGSGAIKEEGMVDEITKKPIIKYFKI